MGTDIHVVVDVRANGEWVGFDRPHPDRIYHIFGILFGVRDLRWEPVARHRGLPEDCSQMVKLLHAHMGEDAHSETWISAAGLLAAQDIDHLFESMCARLWQHLLYCLEEYQQEYGAENVHLVVWFDN